MVTPADGPTRLTRDRLLHLYRSAGSVSADVDSRVRSLGLRAVCRLHCLHSDGRIGPVVSSSTERFGPVAVCLYRGGRAGQARPPVERHSVPRGGDFVSAEPEWACAAMESADSSRRGRRDPLDEAGPGR